MVAVKEGEAALHFIGNGKMGAYLDRGNLVQLFGPPYSTGSVMKNTGGRDLSRSQPPPEGNRYLGQRAVGGGEASRFRHRSCGS